MDFALRAGGDLQLSEAVFARPFNDALVHQVVTAQLAAARQGSRAQKSRSTRRGGGRKPWRQKGTNRARAGTIRSPIWRGGGVTFAAKPQNHAQKVNRKMYRGALCCILSELVRQGRLVGLAEFPVNSSKTSALAKRLKSMHLSRVLIVQDKVDDNLRLAARNLRGVEALDAASVNPVSLVGCDQVLMTAAALRKVEAALA